MRFGIIPFMGSLVFPLCWGQSQQEGSTQERFARVPLSFEENRVQADPEVRFLTRAGAKRVLFADREAVFTAPLRLRTVGNWIAFYPVTPCRIMDTRGATGVFGGPIIAAAQTRGVP